ncbi:hypothetical protein MKY84_03060 [Chryseomicrobium sp. FSL W7-1435]|uniref:hypothetical protein n=1 Tax=Chryseomicrobium sp. FSL W7-1435 TaxID=2921704 RepID=UPI00315B131A
MKQPNQFKTVFEEQKGSYKIQVYYQGDHDLYNQMITMATKDEAFLSYKPTPTLMKLLWRDKFFFFFEKGDNPTAKFPRWNVAKLLKNEVDGVLVEDPLEIPTLERGITEHLEVFAREVAKAHQ